MPHGESLSESSEVLIEAHIEEQQIDVDRGHCNRAVTCRCGNSFNGGKNTCRVCQKSAGLSFCGHIIGCSYCDVSGKKPL